jgi:hypothetical protein
MYVCTQENKTKLVHREKEKTGLKKKEKKKPKRKANAERVHKLGQDHGDRKTYWMKEGDVMPAKKEEMRAISEPETTVMFHTVTARRIH